MLDSLAEHFEVDYLSGFFIIGTHSIHDEQDHYHHYHGVETLVATFIDEAVLCGVV